MDYQKFGYNLVSVREKVCKRFTDIENTWLA